MTVEELSGHLKEHWPAIREQLLNGTYTPQPVKRVEIPKPNGGVRKLQWQRGTTRNREIRKRGIAAQEAAKTAGSSDGPGHLAKTPALNIALPNAYFVSLGLPELTGHG